jgi:hypothetical protein
VGHWHMQVAGLQVFCWNVHRKVHWKNASSVHVPPPLLLLPPPEHVPPEQACPAGQSASEQHAYWHTHAFPLFV